MLVLILIIVNIYLLQFNVLNFITRYNSLRQTGTVS